MDVDDGVNIIAPIVPVFQCVEMLGVNSFQAWFGYNNPNPNNMYITAASENALYANGTVSTIYTSPTKFIIGYVEYAMVVGYV